MTEKVKRSCVDCVTNSCSNLDGKYPAFCPSKDFSLDTLPELSCEFDKPDVHKAFEDAAQAALYANTNQVSRVEETINFARQCGYKKLGIANCRNLVPEARAAAKIFRDADFEVFGIVCKVGSLTRPDLGIEEGNPNALLCNPIYQAQLCNAEGVDLNVIVGLCVGHDALFTQYAEAPTTTLAVKDYKYDNNSVCALRD